MRNPLLRLSLAPSCRSFRRAPLGILLAAALWPGVTLGQATDGKGKVMYKPVACAPCPCQCPDPVARAPGPRNVPSAVPAARPARDGAGRPAATPRTLVGGNSAPTPPVSTAAAASGSVGGSVTLRDSSGQEQADRSGVIVYIAKVPGKTYAALKKARALTQRDKSFVPGIVAITRGSTMDFPNDDKFYHNVFSLSRGNTFDLGLYSAGQGKSVTFENTGIVDVYCNIHPAMWAQILVLDNPFFTAVEPGGSFELSKLPPGTYTVVAQALGGKPVQQQVTITPGARTEVALTVVTGAKSKQHYNKQNQPYSGVYSTN